MSIPIHGLNHITFSVSDLDNSIRFYQSIFEAKLLLRAEGTAYLELCGLWLALNVQADIPRQEIKQSYTHLAFTLDSDDIQSMKQRLEQLGVELRPDRSRVTGEGESLYFVDPDGHLLEFHTGNLVDRLRAYKMIGYGEQVMDDDYARAKVEWEQTR